MSLAPSGSRRTAADPASGMRGRGPGPLVRRGLVRLLRSGGWGVLVAGTFVLLSAAASAPAMFTEAAGNAALRETLGTVPPDALLDDAPVVRIVSGSPPSGARQQELAAQLAAVPGLSRPGITGGSIGPELRPGEEVTPVAAGPGGTRPARLYADSSLADTLIPTAGSRPGGAGLWLPEPLAGDLNLTTGDAFEVGVDSVGGHLRSTTAIAGVYQVAADGRRPADRPGSSVWAQRRAELPADTASITRTAYLLVGDPGTVERLASDIGDEVVWSAEARLSPALPTLRSARRTAARVEALGAGVVAPSGASNGVLRPALVSGVPQLVDEAQVLTEHSQAWTAPLASAGTLVGLAAVLAVAALGLSRRAGELRVSAALGVRPVAQGGLAALELLPVVPLALATGVGTAYGVVRVWGPPAPVTLVSVRAGAGEALLAVALGMLLAAVLAVRTAIAAAAHVDRGAARRRVPWELFLAVAAVATAVGLDTRPPVDGPPGVLDLLVPLLVLAAVGGVGARGLARLLRRPRPSLAIDPLRRPALWLAVRRASGAGGERVLVIALVATGLGMLSYAVAATTSVRTSIADRVAVAAGAGAAATIVGSWQLDPAARDVDSYDPDVALAPGGAPRTPPLPPDSTVVWRARLLVPGQVTNVDVLAVDPAGFDRIALWGEGPELAHARQALAALGRLDLRAAADLRAVRPFRPATVPAIAVASTLHAGDTISARSDRWDVSVRVTATVPAFPGQDGTLPLLVVPAESFLLDLQGADPRLRSDPRRGDPPPAFTTWLWSTGAAGLDRVLGSAGVASSQRTTVAEVAIPRARCRGAQPAVLARARYLPCRACGRRPGPVRRPHRRPVPGG